MTGLRPILTSLHLNLRRPRKKRSLQESLERFKCQLGNPQMIKVECSLSRVVCPPCDERYSSPYELRMRRLGRTLSSVMGR
jgi:hypothetical protein